MFRLWNRRKQLATLVLTLILVLLNLHCMKLLCGSTCPKHPRAGSVVVSGADSLCLTEYRRRSPYKKTGPIVNPIPYSFPINNVHACKKDRINIIIPVHSAVTNFKRRSLSRSDKQGKFARDEKNHSKMLFFVGLPSHSLTNVTAIQQRLEQESRKYNDVIQVNVQDTYRYVVHKAIAVLQWIAMYCPNSEFVLKVDDDVSLNPSDVIGSLCNLRANHTDFIVGKRLLDSKPYRKKGHKYYVSKREYPFDRWPPYITGGGRGFPISTARLLYRQAIRTKIVWLEDVFITGICAQPLGIPLIQNDHFESIEMDLDTEKFVY